MREVRVAAAKANATAVASPKANAYDKEGEPAVAYLGEVSHADCLRAIADADAVANTSNSEGMSGALVEALAAGTNVVARAVEGNVALLHQQDDAKGGEVLVSSDDDLKPYRVASSGALLFDTPSGFTAAVDALRSDAAKAASLAERQREFVSDRLSPAAEEQRYVDLVASVLSRAGK